MYVLARDISPMNTRSALRLRVVRAYDIPEKRSSSILKSKEIGFHDQEGTFLQHTSQKKLLKSLKTFLEKYGDFWVAARVIYVIGRVVEFYASKDILIGGSHSKLVDYFLIENMMYNLIMCTVWDEHVSIVMPYFNNHSDGPLVILIRLCRAKTVNNKVRISSSYNATKIVFNDDSKEFLDFKARKGITLFQLESWVWRVGKMVASPVRQSQQPAPISSPPSQSHQVAGRPPRRLGLSLVAGDGRQHIVQPFEYLMPIFADEEDLIASSDNTLGSGEAHGASKDLDICSLKLIGLHHRFQEMEVTYYV
nr:replication factor A protein 1-like isoform X2 [Ipomoea batatas]